MDGTLTLFLDEYQGYELFIKWLQPPMYCNVPKIDFLLIKITWYKEVLAFLSVYVRGHSSFFSFEFSIIDVQHRSGFRPLRRASTKKYQPSASWCWFGTHVQNCCYWKKALLWFSFNHNVLKLIQTQHSVQFLFRVQFLFQLHFRGFRNISLILI